MRLSLKPKKIGNGPAIHFRLGWGTVFGSMISFVTNHSIGWAIVHGIFGWFYVVYFFAMRWQETAYFIARAIRHIVIR